MAGFGTAGSLLAGAAIVFVLASAVVAFRGWPQIGVNGSNSSMTLIAQRSQAGSATSRRLTTLAGAVAATLTPSARPPARGSGGQAGSAEIAGTPAGDRSDSSLVQPFSSRPGSNGGTTPTPGIQGCVSCGTHPTAAVSLGAVVQGTARSVGTTVTSAGQNLGGAVNYLVGAVANQLSGASAALGSTVRNLGNALAGTIGSTGQGVGNLVSGTGRLLGGVLGGR